MIMFLLRFSNGVLCVTLGKGLHHYTRDPETGGLRAVCDCSLTIPPALKDLYLSRTGRDALAEALAAVERVPDIADARVHNRSVRFRIVGPKNTLYDHPAFRTYCRSFEQPVRRELTAAAVAWDAACRPRQGLQGLVLNALRDRAFELQAFVHYASKHGAEAALEAGRLCEAWT